MIARGLVLLAALLPGPLWAQGYAGLGAEATGFQLPDPDMAMQFPRDHRPHPGFRIEWWYITANLTDATGAPMGLQWTLFRQAAAPEGPQIWMGHAAVTTARRHLISETFARGGIGQAGVTAAPFAAFIDDWEMRSDDDGIDQLTLTASGTDFSYEVTLTADGPLVLHGADGYSVKSQVGQASHYYSQPFYELTGTVTIEGAAQAVTGQAWLDREWSSQPLAGDQEGWDWMSLHLDGGARLMAYRLRGSTNYTVGTWIAPSGAATALAEGDLALTPLALTTTQGRKVPTRWRLQYPGQALDIEVTAMNTDAYMTTLFPYWEGPVAVSGSHAGVGYLEMTGY